MSEEKPSEQLDALAREALARPLPWRQRLVAWLVARVAGISGREGTAGGYWGGVTFWDAIKARASRKR